MLGGMMQSIGVGGTVEAGEMNVSWLTFDNTNNRLGIGQTSPSSSLHLKGSVNESSTANTTTGLILQNSDTTNNTHTSIDFRNSTNLMTAKIGALFTDADDRDTDLYFCTRANGGVVTEQMRIDSSGNVGIGTTTPLSTLDLNGTLAYQQSALTIASGAVTATKTYHNLLPESGTADDLDNINGGEQAGQVLFIRNQTGTNTITIKHNTGNIRLNNSTDFAMNASTDHIMFINDGTNWIELFRRDS